MSKFRLDGCEVRMRSTQFFPLFPLRKRKSKVADDDELAGWAKEARMADRKKRDPEEVPEGPGGGCVDGEAGAILAIQDAEESLSRSSSSGDSSSSSENPSGSSSTSGSDSCKSVQRVRRVGRLPRVEYVWAGSMILKVHIKSS